MGCNDDASLQKYFVDHQESKDFMAQDIPISMLKIDTSKLNKEQKDAYNSVSRLNFLAFKANETNAETLKVELEKVKIILSDEKYKELIEFSDKGNKILIKYLGDDDEADEVIVFGSSKEIGFGIVRVLGDAMSPDKMATLVNVLQGAQVNEEQFQAILSFFK
jgi:predicted RNA-binding protein